MRRPLKLSSRAEASTQVVVVEGEVDMESSPRLLTAVQHAQRHGAAVVVDLADVSYVDSSGVAVLVQGLKAARKRQQEFRLRSPSKQAVAVLKLAGLLTLFVIEDTPAVDPKAGDPAPHDHERKDG